MNNNNLFSYDKYIELIGDKKSCNQYPENKYKNSFIPDYLYKYWNFTSPKINDNLNALINEEIWMPRANTLNDPFEFQMLRDDLDDDDRFMIREYTLYRNSIMSLSANPIQNLMWSHYGNSHTGLCLEFRVQDKDLVFPITYIPDQIDVTDSLKEWLKIKNLMLKKTINEWTNAEKQIMANVLKVMFYKKSDWEYEQEYRITGRKDYVDGDEYGFFYGYMSKLQDLGLMLSRIILGFNCDLENKAKIMNVVNNINKKRLIKLYEYNKKNSSVSQIIEMMHKDNSLVLISQVVREDNGLNLDIVDYKMEGNIYTF